MFDQHLLTDAGVIYDDVNLTERGLRIGEEGSSRGHIADIAAPAEAAATGISDLSQNSFTAGIVVVVAEGNVASFCGKRPSDGGTNSAAGAGDKRRSTFKASLFCHFGRHNKFLI
jgi:hypothetical protein